VPIKAGKEITRTAVAYETGRDSFWLARWLRDRGVDAHVIALGKLTLQIGYILLGID
jgi:transposase